MSAWVRRCLTVASLLAVWLVVRPAAAAAPYCDERGASMLAPMPILDVPDQSVDVGDHPDGCELWLSEGDAYKRGRDSGPASPSIHLDATLPCVILGVPSALAVRVPAFAAQDSVPSGVRSGVDRPPRQEA